ncbi:glutathione S-transferase family protein [Mesorhizobium sp. CN2-181]|uniref:glutathione S-transferase family protein n=1 Tax=Mesorhizobium yinganensis TaxID=3157707 RepID=UPI0032B826FC
MITITAMKWAPPFAAGQVRDHRARWILNEVSWPYTVRLIDACDLASDEYRQKQPFGQVPYMEEGGRPTLFESGAIVIDVAIRAGKLIPPEGTDRSMVISWVIAALNSIEPFLMNVAEVEYFMHDAGQQEARRPAVVAAAEQRLSQLETALGDCQWLVGDAFTIADLMMASVLKIARRLNLLDTHPLLISYQDRCLDRPAYRKAVSDQRAVIERHEMADMRFDKVEKADA